MKAPSIRDLCATLVALCLLGFGIVPAVAAPIPAIDMGRDASITIHKLEQPQNYGLPATGQAQNIDGTTISGVTYRVTQVPNLALNTNAGWEQASTMSTAEALEAIQDQTPQASGTTNQQGVVSFGNLQPGLYVVEETGSPAGVMAAEPMLVSLPHPHNDQWNYDVHIYPKNATVGIQLGVKDQDTVSWDDPVLWQSRSSIPRTKTLDTYVVRNILDPRLKLHSTPTADNVTLACDCNIKFTSADFTIKVFTQNGSEVIEVSFTATGLEKLRTVRAQDPEAAVVINYQATVKLTAGKPESANGEFTNIARVYPDQASLEDPENAVQDQAVTKFGPLQILVHELGKPENRIPGATFKLYLTAEDAPNGTNPVTINGVSKWITNADGTITLNGLRFSDFVNGLDRDDQDALFRTLYAVMTQLPEGWSGEIHVNAATVSSATEPMVIIAQLTQDGATAVPSAPATDAPETEPAAPGTGPDAGGSLPATGAQIAGLSLFAVFLVGLGTLLLKRRRTSPETP